MNSKSPTSRSSTRTATVGLTGGIASGKSTVGTLMANAGCTVTDADRLVAELYRPGEAGSRLVAELFGEQMLDAGGEVNRQRLADVVFADADARGRLERGIHPLVSRRFAELVADAQGLVVFEATLLVDTGGFRNFESLVTVEADEELRIRRAVERGHSETDARARMAAQATAQQRIAVANHVIWNDGSLEQLEQRVEQVVAELRQQLLG